MTSTNIVPAAASLQDLQATHSAGLPATVPLQAAGVLREPTTPGFSSAAGWELAQRIAKAFASSDLMPQAYRGNIPNCLIALEIANRMGASPLLVAQNLYIVHGNPGWSSKFLIATFNQCGRFSAMRYELKRDDTGRAQACRAWALERATGDRLEGAWVTLEMAQAEGWAGKNGSKWKTMPELMLQYRAAAFFVRTYAPELSMGLQTAEEVVDGVIDMPENSAVSVTTETLRARADAQVVQQEQPNLTLPAQTVIDQGTGEIKGTPEQVQPAPSKTPMPYDVVVDAIVTASTPAQLERADALIGRAPQKRQGELTVLSAKQRERIAEAQQRDIAEAQGQPTPSARRGRAPATDGLNLE
jgi:hypothetical protein